MRIAGRMVKGRQFPQFTGQVLERDRQLVCAPPVGLQHVDGPYRWAADQPVSVSGLAGYRGIVQCDGYAAYKQVARRGRAGTP